MGEKEGWWSYSAVYDMLVSCVVVDVYCYAAEGGDFGGELFEAGVVLSGGWGLVVVCFLGIDDKGGWCTVRARRLRPWLWYVGLESVGGVGFGVR